MNNAHLKVHFTSRSTTGRGKNINFKTYKSCFVLTEGKAARSQSTRVQCKRLHEALQTDCGVSGFLCVCQPRGDFLWTFIHLEDPGRKAGGGGEFPLHMGKQFLSKLV